MMCRASSLSREMTNFLVWEYRSSLLWCLQRSRAMSRNSQTWTWWLKMMVDFFSISHLIFLLRPTVTIRGRPSHQSHQLSKSPLNRNLPKSEEIPFKQSSPAMRGTETSDITCLCKTSTTQSSRGQVQPWDTSITTRRHCFPIRIMHRTSWLWKAHLVECRLLLVNKQHHWKLSRHFQGLEGVKKTWTRMSWWCLRTTTLQVIIKGNKQAEHQKVWLIWRGQHRKRPSVTKKTTIASKKTVSLKKIVNVSGFQIYKTTYTNLKVFLWSRLV